MPGHLDSWAARVRTKRWLFWTLTLLTFGGLSGSTIAGLIGIPWFWIPGALGLIGFVLFHEVTYALWREQQARRGGGLHGTALTVWAQADPATGRVRFETSATGRPGQSIVLPEHRERGVPKGIRFERPTRSEVIRDLPYLLRWRERLTRWSIEVTELVPGGVVLDETNTPPRCDIEAYLYFGRPEESDG